MRNDTGCSLHNICSPSTGYSRMSLLSAILVAVTMQSKSYLESTVHTLFPHCFTPTEPFPREYAPSVEKRRRSQFSDLCLPHDPISSSAAVLLSKSSNFHDTLQTFRSVPDESSSYSPQCVVHLLILFARHLAYLCLLYLSH